ncbi:unnamed protein product [Phytophthora fragariaefolia]|uniref:Unnamed protein product n=1 Tax=Phytophthora fragariaefolia TaxID=1490495 RepID=A0A9W7DAH2_9STRA|nr:unnamed protein product [Phytophthora fragariaefolia]
MREAVHNWVSACQDCGSRKARPKAVVPPLRRVKTGDVCDRWAIDVAGPLPETIHGNRYVIAAVEYTTRYVVAEAVPEHTAKAIAKFLMNRVVLVYGPMREIMMDGAREFGSKVTTELLALMQVKQATPVPYRPNLLGLVERFHRTWKNIVRLYVDEEQTDWDDFVPSALYAYNSSTHATHGFQPNELMMGRKLRTPAEWLRRSRLTYPNGTLAEYHEVLIRDLKTARDLAAVALQKEQARQAIYYNRRNERHRVDFHEGQLVWVYRPARGPGITKFGHRWRGPAQIVEAAGYDNFKVKMLESEHELVVHCSFLLPFYYPMNLLDQMAKDMALDLREEAIAAADIEEDDSPNAEQEGLEPLSEEQASSEPQIIENAPPGADTGTSGEAPAAAPDDDRSEREAHEGDERSPLRTTAMESTAVSTTRAAGKRRKQATPRKVPDPRATAPLRVGQRKRIICEIHNFF